MNISALWKNNKMKNGEMCWLYADSSESLAEYIETSVIRTILLQLGITRSMRTDH